MEVTYQVEGRDHLDYNRFVVNRVPALKRQSFLQMFFVPVLLAFELLSLHLPWFLYLSLIIVLAGIWNAYLFWVRRRTVIAATNARPGVIGLHTFVLGPDGIREQTTVVEAFARWPKVTEIAENRQLIILFLGPRYGFIIPKRAFPTAEGAQIFLATARAYHQSALSGTPIILPEAPQSWPPAPQRLNS